VSAPRPRDSGPEGAGRPDLGFPRVGAEFRAWSPEPSRPGPDSTGESAASGRHALCSFTVVVTRSRSTVALLAAALLGLLGSGRALAGPADERTAAQAELAVLAPRIEQLKREAAGGRGQLGELERLLARAQALAALLERMASQPVSRPAATGPDAQELRERADALRDRADKEAAALAKVERRLEELERRAELAERLEALGAASDLFAERATGRGQAGGNRGSDGASTATPGSTSTSGGGPGLRASAEPGGLGAAAAGEDAGLLRRSRAELARSLSALRARAEALEAEARAAEQK
jgi:hypothetical protein